MKKNLATIVSGESNQNALLGMQDKEREAQTRSVYEHTRGREHRSDAVLRPSSSIWTDSAFPYHLVDLTHTLDEKISSWTGTCGFHQEVKLDYDLTTSDVSFRVQQLKMHAGIGTHIDAPAHCSRGKTTIEQLDINNLIAPCVMIDVSAQAHESYTLSLDDLALFEKKEGMIALNSFVLIRTGWDQFWNQPERYHNNYRFPSVSKEAADFLIQRKAVGLGIDTLSPDRPESGYPVHAAFLGSEKYIVENVANSISLPPTGSFILALPIKTHGGTEAPIRLVGLIPMGPL